MNNYILKYHDFFRERIIHLTVQVRKIKSTLAPEDYKQHETVKLLGRIVRASQEIIPQNPNQPDYFLKGSLSKFRRYKQGIKRYRLIFCYSSKPPVIVYLYINDQDHLRQEGSHNDPYKEFTRLVKSGVFNHNPHAPNMASRLHDEFE